MSRPLLSLAVLLVAALGLDPSAHAASVTASAWSYETSDAHSDPWLATAGISRQGPNAPGIAIRVLPWSTVA